MRTPVSPLSTTTTRRTSCTLATRIPPNYEPGSRFRVLSPDGSEVDVTVPAGAEAIDHCPFLDSNLESLGIDFTNCYAWLGRALGFG